jgi:hypothetical protein
MPTEYLLPYGGSQTLRSEDGWYVETVELYWMYHGKLNLCHRTERHRFVVHKDGQTEHQLVTGPTIVDRPATVDEEIAYIMRETARKGDSHDKDIREVCEAHE